MASQGFIEKSQVPFALKKISLTTNLQEAVQDADYIQESVFENYEVKKDVVENHILYFLCNRAVMSRNKLIFCKGGAASHTTHDLGLLKNRGG